jgi:hypothetical protein
MTDRILRLNILRKKWPCKLSLVILLLVAGFLPLSAQTITLSKQLEFAGPSAISLDRLGNFYFADQRRTVYKFSPDGTPTSTYSPAISGGISSIEARNGIKILVFSYDQQRITLLDRFLREISFLDLSRLPENTNNDLFKAATFSGDDQFWLFNESTFSITKINALTQQRYFSTALNLIVRQKSYDVRFMREYQNNLYVVEKSAGIFVFDNMGNYRKTLPFSGLDYIGFTGDELYYLKDGKLHFYHLYNGQVRQIPVAPEHNYRNVLVGEKMLYLFSDRGVDIFTIGQE